jgi:hypothetical protein
LFPLCDSCSHPLNDDDDETSDDDIHKICILSFILFVLLVILSLYLFCFNKREFLSGSTGEHHLCHDEAPTGMT